MDVVLTIATVVSALAALGAVGYAYKTVRLTQALRRDDQLARVAELVPLAGEGALELVSETGRPSWTYPVTRGQLRAALALLDDPLPACRELASGDYVASLSAPSADDARDLTLEALAELAAAAGSRE